MSSLKRNSSTRAPGVVVVVSIFNRQSPTSALAGIRTYQTNERKHELHPYNIKLVNKYLESDVETFLLMETHVPLLWSSAEFSLGHAERQDDFCSLGYLRIGTYKTKISS